MTADKATVDNAKRIFLAVMCALTLTAILFAGLRPLEFSPENRAKRLVGRAGIMFSGPGIVYSAGLIDLGPGNGPVTVEVIVEPSEAPSGRLSDIISFYGADGAWIWSISQWKTHLILRGARSNVRNQGASKRDEEADLNNAFTPGRPIFLSIISGPSGSAAFIDGKPSANWPRFTVLNAGSEGIVIGNSSMGGNYLKGAVYGLALYGRALGAKEIADHYSAWASGRGAAPTDRDGLKALYSFDGHGSSAERDLSGMGNDLVMPAVFKPLKRIFFVMPWEDLRLNRSHAKDVAVNILGFVPFGLFFTAFFLCRPNATAKGAFIAAVALGFALSLSIELIQAFMPFRTSSATDLLCNTAGATIGSIAYLLASAKSLKSPAT